jgi:DNA polymerase I-like protein with 3'-5' exonuclease and polymerase domains
MNSLFDGFDLTVNSKIVEKTTTKQKPVKTNRNEKQLTNQSLFSGDGLNEFNIELNKPRVETLLSKLNGAEETETSAAKILKSKSLTLEEKLAIIKRKVLEVLGKQRKNVVVIRTKEEFEDYVSKAIEFGRIAIDTETNNSTDPMTCQLMGLCLYYKGGKQAYIPIHHVNPETGEHLEWQLTEDDCREQLQRIKDAGTFVVMHNGKFDYEVIKCTCGIEIEPNWDTIIGAHTINESERMGLKWQYIDKIDPTQAKYDIESLFIVPYKYVDPEIFALYAATDSRMTDELYEYQFPILTAPGNEKLYWLFQNIEMPIVKVTAEIELIGVCIDQEFGEKLRLKYNQLLEELDARIDQEISTLQPQINAWKLSKQANERTKQFQPKKTKMSQEKIEERYPLIDQKTGLRYKVGKALIEQLGDPINLGSPTQLAILFYDILGCPMVNKKSPRATGKEELEAIADRTDNALCKLILERRGIMKLISTYIDVIPALARHWPDGRIRYSLNPVGTETGRFSSGGSFKFLDEDENSVEMASINSQNIPSKGNGKITRMLFQAKEKFNEVEIDMDRFTIHETAEIETIDGWKYGKDLVALKDSVLTDEGLALIEVIKYDVLNKEYEFTVRKY